MMFANGLADGHPGMLGDPFGAGLPRQLSAPVQSLDNLPFGPTHWIDHLTIQGGYVDYDEHFLSMQQGRVPKGSPGADYPIPKGLSGGQDGFQVPKGIQGIPGADGFPTPFGQFGPRMSSGESFVPRTG